MDLKSGYPFWAIKNGLMTAFPPLTDDVRCDVAIVGGGITGALIADEFSQHGHAVVVLEQRDVGWGSSAASTALLQYEIDTHMTALAQRYGEADAVLAYRACLDAIPQLQAVATELGDVDFATTHSLYYASKRGHAKDLREEFALRRAHGLPVEFLEAAAVRERFGIAAPCAIVSSVAARVDPYRMACRLLTRLVERGGHVSDRTTMDRMELGEHGVTLHTSRGACVRADHVVLAAGYAGQRYLKRRVARTRSSYAFITDPIDADTLGPFASTMVWESARPYLYLRKHRRRPPARRRRRRRDRPSGAPRSPGRDQGAELEQEGPASAARHRGAPLLRVGRHLRRDRRRPALLRPPRRARPARALRDGLRRQRDHLQHARRRTPARAGRAARAPARAVVRVRSHRMTAACRYSRGMCAAIVGSIIATHGSSHQPAMITSSTTASSATCSRGSSRGKFDSCGVRHGPRTIPVNLALRAAVLKR